MAAAEETSKSSEAFPMKGGDGPNSYTKNSIYQRGAVDVAKQLLDKEIAEKLDIEISLPSNTFNIADLGCSVGPNTFSSVENILEAVQLKYQCQGLDSQIPEFQVFFNDHILNDFNMLFKSLPPNRQYYAAGVPGSFYGRIFPNNSIHLVHSSSSNHWLSRVPKEVVDKNCPAWNKGEIHYSNSTNEVVKAYEAQYAEDMECFLHARSREVVSGGLMVLIIPGRPNGTPHSKTLPNMMLQLLGTSLMEMARKGVVLEEKVDSFNIPMYYMSPQELEAAVEGNGCFSIEKIENLPSALADGASIETRVLGYHMRAAADALIKQQFGEEILDELFDLYCKKLEEKPSIFESGKGINFLAVLKRKPN
ncbi:putative loganate O-methyltransferase [Rosa chinensis]|uniref:Putative loganate O-methyltransferase n=1 Tax=Rosa chinensis TaxID=74649 RepID=A0A2P6P493_ROSCH|nr:loganic acid O-methyltransferase [Rosa chinensis]PRQ16751.1 putative loganate O-methyltransferase [Rosa chinensis]